MTASVGGHRLALLSIDCPADHALGTVYCGPKGASISSLQPDIFAGSKFCNLFSDVKREAGVNKEMALGTDWDQGHTSLSKPFTAIGLRPAAPQSSVIPLELCALWQLCAHSQAFLVLGSHSALSPPGSRGAELSGCPELGGRRDRGRGRWGDPARGEAPPSPSFLVPAAAAASAQPCEKGAGDSRR